MDEAFFARWKRWLIFALIAVPFTFTYLMLFKALLADGLSGVDSLFALGEQAVPDKRRALLVLVVAILVTFIATRLLKPKSPKHEVVELPRRKPDLEETISSNRNPSMGDTFSPRLMFVHVLFFIYIGSVWATGRESLEFTKRAFGYYSTMQILRERSEKGSECLFVIARC